MSGQPPKRQGTGRREGRHPEVATKASSRNINQTEGASGESSVTYHEVQVEWRGSLPPPALLAAYNRAAPNGGDRMLAMAEQEQSHRHRIETRGQVFAFVITLVGIIGGGTLLAFDKSASGFTLLAVALGPIISSFLERKMGESDASDDTVPPPEVARPLPPAKDPAQG